MKITKYPHSCLMVETNNKKILIDAGIIKYKDEYLTKWDKADIILITHKHFDHINEEALSKLNIPIYGTEELQEAFKKLKINIIKEDDIIDLDNIKIEVVHAIHGYNPLLKDGKEVFENVGYIIDDGNKRLYITSDTICFNNNYKADVVALPVTAHGLTMSAFEAALFAKELGVELVLPIHMDNETFITDTEYMKKIFAKYETNYKILEIEEDIEI